MGNILPRIWPFSYLRLRTFQSRVWTHLESVGGSYRSELQARRFILVEIVDSGQFLKLAGGPNRFLVCKSFAPILGPLRRLGGLLLRGGPHGIHTILHYLIL